MKAGCLALASIASSLILALYVTGYFFVIERQASSFYATGSEATYYNPRARVGDEAALYFYYPVIELDHLLRPQHWEPTSRQFYSLPSS